MLEYQALASGTMLFSTWFLLLQLYIWSFSILVVIIVLVPQTSQHPRLLKRRIPRSPYSRSPTLLDLPFEIRCNIYRYVLPTRSSLRVMFNGKSMKFRYCPMFYDCPVAQCLACNHTGTSFFKNIDRVLLIVSSATRRECIDFMFGENAVLMVNGGLNYQVNLMRADRLYYPSHENASAPQNQRRDFHDTQSIIASYALQLRFVIIRAEISWDPMSECFKRQHEELMSLIDKAANVKRFYLHVDVKPYLGGPVERRVLD